MIRPFYKKKKLYKPIPKIQKNKIARYRISFHFPKM